MILNQALPSIKPKLDICENEFWIKSKDYESLSTYEVCAQELIKNVSIPEIKILPKVPEKLIFFIMTHDYRDDLHGLEMDG